MSSVHPISPKNLFLSLCFLLIAQSTSLFAQGSETQKSKLPPTFDTIQSTSYIQNTWTWIGGDKTGEQKSVFGVQGQASSLNKPGSRVFSMTWTDSSGVNWLFGGSGGLDENDNKGYLNDLWKWDGENWTWVGGSNDISDTGSASELGVRNATNWPSSRNFLSALIDTTGQALIVGGQTWNGSTSSFKNDIWSWDGEQWAWVSGSLVDTQAGIYGTKNLAASTNILGARYIYHSWMDSQNRVRLFGGFGQDVNNNVGYLNDTWVYQQKQIVGRAGKTAQPTFSVNSGIYTDSVRMAISSNTPNSAIFYTTDGTTPSISSSVYSSPIFVQVNTTIKALARGTTTLK